MRRRSVLVCGFTMDYNCQRIMDLLQFCQIASLLHIPLKVQLLRLYQFFYLFFLKESEENNLLLF